MRISRWWAALALLASGVTLGGCLDQGSTSGPTEPRTAASLLAVATTFNRNYAENRDGPVYDRWDRASQAVITRSQYLRRHDECPTAPGAAIVESATPGPHGFWEVRYSIDAVQLVDYWIYQHGQWRFDLWRSNPAAIRLYRLPFAAYAIAVGCRARSSTG